MTIKKIGGTIAVCGEGTSSCSARGERSSKRSWRQASDCQEPALSLTVHGCQLCTMIVQNSNPFLHMDIVDRVAATAAAAAAAAISETWNPQTSGCV